MLASEGDFERIYDMSEERKQFHTSSESTADRKVLERTKNLPTSIEVVRESVVAIHPSGNSSKLVILLFFTVTFTIHKR